jgi:hypothetical protein
VKRTPKRRSVGVEEPVETLQKRCSTGGGANGVAPGADVLPVNDIHVVFPDEIPKAGRQGPMTPATAQLNTFDSRGKTIGKWAAVSKRADGLFVSAFRERIREADEDAFHSAEPKRVDDMEDSLGHGRLSRFRRGRSRG